MKKINEHIRDAVEEALVSKKPGERAFGNARVSWDGKSTRVSYCGNPVFQYDSKTNDWWLDDCGWPTTMTKEKTAAALVAAGLPYRYFVRKGCMWLRNADTGKEWKCGSGRITRQDVEIAGL